jgi:hypothetical protein
MILPAILMAFGSVGSAPSVSPPIECTLPDGWSEATRADPHYIVFGEKHGTREGPALVSEIACALSRRGEALLVALELSADQDAALQAAWEQPRATFSQVLLDTMPDWRQRDDGVTSRAMLELLVELHALKESGATVDVVGFNGARDEAQRARFADLPMQGPHEAAQAENIRIANANGRYDRVLVLVGGLHARKQRYELQGVAFEPMAMKLAPASETLSLRMIYGTGTAWNCQLSEDASVAPGEPVYSTDLSCAIHPLEGREGMRGAPAVGLWPTDWQNDGDDAWDGYAWVGTAHASPPAIEGAGER